jgi:hypothetical protein
MVYPISPAPSSAAAGRRLFEVSPELQMSADALEHIHVKSPVTSQMIPLSTFVRLDASTASYLSVSHTT